MARIETNESPLLMFPHTAALATLVLGYQLVVLHLGSFAFMSKSYKWNKAVVALLLIYHSIIITTHEAHSCCLVSQCDPLLFNYLSNH